MRMKMLKRPINLVIALLSIATVVVYLGDQYYAGDSRSGSNRDGRDAGDDSGPTSVQGTEASNPPLSPSSSSLSSSSSSSSSLLRGTTFQTNETNDHGNDNDRELDFAIIGFPKTGTSFLLELLHRHPQVVVPPREFCQIFHSDGEDKLRQFLNDCSGDDGVNDIEGSDHDREENGEKQNIDRKYGIKCPTMARAPLGLQRLVDLSKTNRTKLIVGVRHPVWFFQSFYNYRVLNAHNHNFTHTIPDPNDLINATWRDVSTALAKFEDHLRILGKVDGNDSIRDDIGISSRSGNSNNGNNSIIISKNETDNGNNNDNDYNIEKRQGPKTESDETLNSPSESFHPISEPQSQTTMMMPQSQNHQTQRVVRNSFKVFIYVDTQLQEHDAHSNNHNNNTTNNNITTSTPSSRLSTFQTDLQHFLNLTTPFQTYFESIPHVNKNRMHYPEYMDICQSRYEGLRDVLVRQGETTAEWILEEFLKSEDVVVSGEGFFRESLLRWGVDPCVVVVGGEDGDGNGDGDGSRFR